MTDNSAPWLSDPVAGETAAPSADKQPPAPETKSTAAPSGSQPWTSDPVVGEQGKGGIDILTPEEKAQVKAVTQPDVDYTTGVDTGTLSNFLGASNDTEKKLALDKGMQSKQYDSYQNDNGLWTVTKGGKKISVVPLAFGKNLAAMAWAHPFQTIGLLASSVVPETRLAKLAWDAVDFEGLKDSVWYAAKRAGSGLYYNALRANLTGLFSAAGYGADEAVKYADNLWAKSSDELKKDLLAAYTWGAGPEMAMRTVGSAVRTLGTGYKIFNPRAAKVTTAEMGQEGLTPQLGFAAPASKFIPLEQAVATRLFGFEPDRANFRIIKDKIRAFLIRAGMPAQTADRELTHVLAGAKANDLTEFGMRLQDRAKELLDQRTAEAVHSRAGMQTTLDNKFKFIEDNVGAVDPQTQNAVRDSLITSRRQFSKEGRVFYNDAKELAANAGQPVVLDTADAKKFAKEGMAEIDVRRDKNGNAVTDQDKMMEGMYKRILDLPDYIDPVMAHDKRSELFQAGAYSDLEPTAEKHGLNKVAGAFSDMLKQPGLSGATKAVTDKLAEGDAFWKKGIQKYKGIIMKQLAADPNRTRQLDPHMTANIVFDPRFSKEAARVKSAVDGGTWTRLASAFWDKLKRDSMNPDKTINADKFHSAIMENRKLLDTAFGPEKAAEMEAWAKQNRALNGKPNAAELTPDNFQQQLKDYHDKLAANDAVSKSTYIKELTDTRIPGDKVLDYMLRDPRRVTAARDFYGADSPEWKTIKTTTMGHVLSSALGPGHSARDLFSYGNLTRALDSVGDRTLAEMYDSGTVQDLRKLARAIDGLAEKSGHGGTGIFALAAVVLHPLEHVGTIAGLFTWGTIFEQRWFINWLSRGISDRSFSNIDKVGNFIKRAVYMGIPGVQSQSQHGAEDVQDQYQRDRQMLQEGAPQ